MFQRVVERLKQADKQISFGTYNIIRQRVGQDAHRVFQELEKAIAYIGEKKRIEEKDIRGLIAETINESIFALTDAIGRKNVSQALLSLHRLIRSGEAPIKVNALIARQVRLLLQARLIVEERLLHEDAGMIIQAVSGGNTRVDFHDDPVEEWFHQIKGDIIPHFKIINPGLFCSIQIKSCTLPKIIIIVIRHITSPR